MPQSMKCKRIDDERSRVIYGNRPTKFIIRRALLCVDVVKHGAQSFGYVIERENDLTKEPEQIDLFPYTTQWTALHAVWLAHYKGM